MRDIVDWDQIAEEEQQRLARLEKQSAVKRWAKYKRPNPFSNAYGYGSTLYKLRGDMVNHDLTPITRKGAAKNIAKILNNIADKKLMSMRERLIRATRAGDRIAQHKISQQMRDYLREDRETGIDIK